MTDTLTLTADDVTALIDQQRALESTAVEWGRDNFRNRVEKAKEYGEATVAGAARKVLQDDMEKLIACLTVHNESFANRRGPKPMDVKLMAMIGVETTAYITAKCILDHLAEQMNKTKLTMAIAERIISQAKYQRFEDEAPALFQYVVKGFKTTNYGHMSKVMAHAMNTVKDLKTGEPLHIDTSDLDAFSDTQRETLGTILLDHFITATAAVTVETLQHVTNKRGRKEIRTEQCVVPTLKTLEWIDKRNAAAEAMCPINLPMVVPPLPWAAGVKGGYRFQMYGRYTLTRTVSKQHRAAMEHRDMPVVYRAINALQDTAWQINPNVVSLLSLIDAHGGDMAGVPKLNKIALPAKPEDIETNDVARKQYRKDAKRVHEANLSRRLRSADYLRTMQVVSKFKDARAMYFVYTMDFRGRVYPVCTYLNPQGDDLSKSLLQFASGKPLGPTGARWLALHGAAALDKLPDGRKVSTLTLDERVQWINDNSAWLVQIAKDPMGNRWFMDRDAKGKSNVGEPLSFYAFCCEWAGYVEQGESYVSNLPVCVDGTNNGLQHFGALFRDEIGGEAVNLLPHANPRDVYKMVAEAVLDMLQDRAVEDDLAHLWVKSGLIDRTLCKRPTMTFGYGSKAYGFSKQIVEELKGRENFKRELRPLFDRIDDEGKLREGGNLVPAADYLSKIIYAVLRELVTKAVEGMEWMRATARVVVKSGKCVEWNVPLTGFFVMQHYMVMEKKQIRTALCGGISRSVVRTETNTVAAAKQASAIAPNIVHSLDAAALQLTVNAALDAGVTHFQMIHDSYGTHAADMGTLSQVLREQFVRLYQSGVVENLAAQFAAQAPEGSTMPEVPAFGTLDLEGIKKSLYFFS